MRYVKAWNKALLFKVLCHVQEKDSLWIRWIHHTYLERNSLQTSEVSHEDSPLVKKLLQIWDEILGVPSTASVIDLQYETTNQGQIILCGREGMCTMWWSGGNT